MRNTHSLSLSRHVRMWGFLDNGTDSVRGGRGAKGVRGVQLGVQLERIRTFVKQALNP